MGVENLSIWAASRLLSRFTRIRGAGRMGDACVDSVVERWNERGSAAAATARLGRRPPR